MTDTIDRGKLIAECAYAGRHFIERYKLTLDESHTTETPSVNAGMPNALVVWEGSDSYGKTRIGIKVEGGEVLFTAASNAEAFEGEAEKVEAHRLEVKASPPVYSKGAQVRIVKGKSGVGFVGSVFWTKDGDWGQRLGVKDASGRVEWTSSSNVEPVAGIKPRTRPAAGASL